MSAGKLIVQETDGGLKISGLADCDKRAELFVGVGTVEEPIEIDVKEAAAKLPAAVRRSIYGGEQVMDGLIRFAQPIFVKGASLNPATSRRVGKTPETKQAAYTLDDTGHRALLHILDDIAAGEGHIKAATHPFHDYLIDAIEDAKVDGTTVGFNVPVKVAFRDDATKDLFMNWFGQVQRKKKAAVGMADLIKAASAGRPTNVEALAAALVASGAVKSPLAALLG